MSSTLESQEKLGDLLILLLYGSLWELRLFSQSSRICDDYLSSNRSYGGFSSAELRFAHATLDPHFMDARVLLHEYPLRAQSKEIFQMKMAQACYSKANDSATPCNFEEAHRVPTISNLEKGPMEMNLEFTNGKFGSLLGTVSFPIAKMAITKYMLDESKQPEISKLTQNTVTDQ